MSTKIYNGWAITEHYKSFNDIMRFCDELRSKVNEYQYNKFIEYSIHEMIYLVYQCARVEYSINKKSPNIDSYVKKFEDYMKTLYHRHYNSWEGICKSLIYNEKIRTCEEYKGILNVSIPWVIYSDVAEECSLSDSVMSSVISKNLSADVCIHPSRGKCIMLSYSLADELLRVIANSNNSEDREFVKYWGLVDYSFWNNTDRPDDISDKVWNSRGKEYDRILKGCVPSDSCLTLNMFNMYTCIGFYMRSKQYSNIVDMLPTHESLCTYIANEIVECNYKNDYKKTKELSVSGITSLVSDIRKYMKSDEGKREIEQVKKDIEEYVPDMSHVLNGKIKDLVPSFLKYKGLK